MITRTKLIASFAALAVAAPLSAMAQSATNPESRVEIGYLECSLLNKSGNIVKSSETFTCTFDPLDASYPDEIYVARVTNWGVDLSTVETEKIRWAVLSPAELYENGVLEGEYAGLSAEVAAGWGVGVNAMVGGLEKSVALQPVSVTTQEGVGVAAGVKNMELEFVSDKLQ